MQAEHAPLREDANGNLQVVLFLVLHINVGDAMLCNHLKSSGASRSGICVSIFLLEVFTAPHGILDLLLPLKSLENRRKKPQTADRQE